MLTVSSLSGSDKHTSIAAAHGGGGLQENSRPSEYACRLLKELTRREVRCKITEVTNYEEPQM